MNAFQHPITQALQPVIFGICRDKSKLRIDERQAGKSLSISASASPDDSRILIGKGGRTVNAIARLVRRAGERCRINADFVLEPSDRCESPNEHAFIFNSHFNDVTFSRLLKDVCKIVGIDTKSAQISLDPDKKVRVYIPARNVTERELLSDIGLIFFSLGFSLGRKVDIKPVQHLDTRTL